MSAAKTKRNIEGIGMTSQRTRVRLVERLRDKGIRDERVLAAMAHVPRHMFVDEGIETRAYEDTALPIGHGQTISQPYIVALMTQSIMSAGDPKRVLEVGTGSGYQAAVLAQLIPHVYSVERLLPLFQRAQSVFRTLGYTNVITHHADGEWGWAKHEPYDAIMVTAAPQQVPESLIKQLKVGGVMIIPLGRENADQRLIKVTRTEQGIEEEEVERVRFVPFLSGRVGS
ncbi:MAG: protein-L-isoaspartate(D-aspartate) O-methyltransferase [Pseudomonadota bacterium]